MSDQSRCRYCGNYIPQERRPKMRYCSLGCQTAYRNSITPAERHRLRCEYIMRSNPTYNKMLNRLIREQGPDDGHREALDIVCKAEPILDTTRTESLP